MRGELQELANAVDPERIRVLTVPYANKRLQMSHGIKHTTTDIIVFADDDAIWPPTLLPYMLACFEDQKVGGVGTSQRVMQVGARMTVWEVLAAFRLTIRNIEISSSTHIDGGVCCLSGRTAAYRTIILKDPEFLHGFTHDYWLGKYQLNSGDDKFLTRWMVSHGWTTYIQCCKEAEILSTMKPNWRFLKQVLRWTRNTWRSDLRSLFMERYIWTAHPYVAYTMVISTSIRKSSSVLNPTCRWTSCSIRSHFWLVLYSLRTWCSKAQNLWMRADIICLGGTSHVYGLFSHLFMRYSSRNVILCYIVWLTVTRTLKLLPHLWHQPSHIIYVPAFILFGYYFAIMKVYALLTLHEVRACFSLSWKVFQFFLNSQTGWGTRAGIGDPAAATAAASAAKSPSDEKLAVEAQRYGASSSMPNFSQPVPMYRSADDGFGVAQEGF